MLDRGRLVVALVLALAPSCHVVLDFRADVTDRDAGAGEDGAGNDGAGGCDVLGRYFADVDGDGFGDPLAPRDACTAPSGFVANDADCDDGAVTVHPGAPEVCDGIDDDCDLAGDGPGCKVGCADGEREAFFDAEAEPRLAACAGGFALAGLVAVTPACGRAAGDDGANPNGIGCNANDLCATGWHICASAADVAASSVKGCQGATLPTFSPVFFATRQSGPGGFVCGTGQNDLFGCGNLGNPPDPSCVPLDRTSDDLCMALGAPWSCGLDSLRELVNVTKPGAAAGGVLCCQDP